jgi:hypothetical protein
VNTVQCSHLNRKGVQCKRRVASNLTPPVCPAHRPKQQQIEAAAALQPPPESLYPQLGLVRLMIPDPSNPGRFIRTEWTHKDFGDEHAAKIISGEIPTDVALAIEKATKGRHHRFLTFLERHQLERKNRGY